MSGINKVILVGNVGKDPEMRYLEGGIAIAKFTLATNEVRKDKDGNKVDQTEWHNVVLWRNLAEVAEKFVRKGSLLYVEGKIKTRSWDDKDGNKRYTTEIVGDNMTLLGKRTTDETSAVHETAKVAEPSLPSSADVPADDLPF